MLFHRCFVLIFFPLYCFYGQTGWQWNNPLPQGNDLNEIIFVDSTTVIAVGNDGSLVRSSDAGSSWSLIAINTISSLQDITFSGNTGYAVGDSGVIIKTTNAGFDWSRLYSGTNQGLSGVSFSTTQIGTAVGKNGTVLRTTDGGNNWVFLNAFVTPDLKDVDFVNDSLGYVVGDSSLIMKTTNGGATWLKSFAGSDASQIRYSKVTFLNVDTGWIVFRYGFSSGIARTTNGGYGWTATVGSGGIYYFYDVHFADTLHGIAVATNGDPRIYVTSDGGAVWNRIEIAITRFSPCAVSLHSNGKAIIIGRDGRIFRSTNHGNTWENKSEFMRGVIKGIYFPNSEIGIAIQDSGTLLRTTNSGMTWNRTIMYLGPFVFNMPSMSGIHFSDSLHGGISIWYGGNLFTSDGGKTWTLRNGMSATNNIFLLDSVRVLTIGAGNVQRSTDQGFTWTVQQLALSRMNGIDFYQSRIGYIVGDSGFVYRSIDQGVSWARQFIGSITPLKDVVVFDSLTAIIVGNSGTILKTTDAGVVWNAINSGIQSDILSVCFINRDIGWAAGSFGAILYTSNGGTSWSRQASGTKRELRTIFFTDKNTGYIAGESGTILKTTDGGRPVELKSLTAKLQNKNTVELRWRTASETNNFGFEIERKVQVRSDGNNGETLRRGDWERIGFVKGYGTTTDELTYHFADALVFQFQILHLKSLQYRLKQIDMDGSYEYSRTVEIHFPTSENLVLEQNYPNPVFASSHGSTATMIRFSLPSASHTKLTIVNPIGKLVQILVDETLSSGEHLISFDTRKLPAGMYFYLLMYGGKNVVRKMIIER